MIEEIEIFHVLTVDDLKEHEEKEDCHCKPSITIVENGNRVVTHNAYDCRKLTEEINSN